MLPPGPDAAVAEQVLERVAALLDPDQGQAEVDNGIADDVVGHLALQGDEHQPAVRDDREPAPGQRAGQLLAAFFDFDREDAGVLGERAERCRP